VGLGAVVVVDTALIWSVGLGAVVVVDTALIWSVGLGAVVVVGGVVVVFVLVSKATVRWPYINRMEMILTIQTLVQC
jgi:hypothetical protein